MKRLQAFKYELIPSGEQLKNMRCYAGMRRFVFNRGLALQKERLDKKLPLLGYGKLCKLLTEWRNSAKTPWLMNAPVHILQQALKDLGRAFKNFFEKRADFPTFCKKGRRNSFRFPDPKQIAYEDRNSRLKVPKLGWLRFRNSRSVVGELRNVTLSERCGRWYASIQTEQDVQPMHFSIKMVALDMGVARFATLSDGGYYLPLNSLKTRLNRLAFLQRKLARQKKFQCNWLKTKRKIQLLHRDIANARYDYLHKISHALSKNHAIVVMEDLQIANMSKSAAGTRILPGRNVKAKAGLNRAILDQGWGEFKRQLDYKLGWRGGRLILVPARNTSRKCPKCHVISALNRLTQAQFKCIGCGFKENADYVAALNILAAGHAVLACGESVL